MRFIQLAFACCFLLSAASCQQNSVQVSDHVEADNSSVTSADASPAEGGSDNAEAGGSDGTASAVFEKRILPIFKAAKPSSCTECHLRGVDLKDYIQPDQAKALPNL